MFDKNNICCHAGGEDRGCIMCCYGGIPEHVEPENCGDGSCEWFERQLPDMREKVKEYISELDTEIDRCNKEISNLSYDEVQVRANRAKINVYQCRAKTSTEVKNDLQSRLDELI